MDLDALVRAGALAVLTGAGMSTGSGIPDYRGESGRQRPAKPMTFQDFTGSAAARQRYWARSHLGWRTIARAAPNAAHRAVADLQSLGLVEGIVTQNVDGLHQGAGATGVVELHGALDRVVCLSCRDVTRREALEGRLDAANPGFTADGLVVLPDGDVLLTDTGGFTVVDCDRCGGLLKPDVVFFGETVPRDRVDASYALVDRCSALLVLGSSLTVMSGYRFVLHAAKTGTPVAVVNLGPTRGDALADVRVDAPLERLLPELVTRVRAGSP